MNSSRSMLSVMVLVLGVLVAAAKGDEPTPLPPRI
jgi:hypothetical protein